MPETRWSLVSRARGDDEEACRQALEELLTQYLPVLKNHLRTFFRLAPHDADDILQSFVAGQLLTPNSVLARADSSKGRLRNYLLRSLKYFVLGEQRKRNAAKRAALDQHAFRLDENRDTLAGGLTFDDTFNVEWARHIVDQTIERMHSECRRKNRMLIWDVFSRRLLDPFLDGSRPPRYEDLVSTLGIDSPTQAMNALVTAKRMFRRTLRDVIQETVAETDDVDREICELKRILGIIHAGNAPALHSTERETAPTEGHPV